MGGKGFVKTKRPYAQRYLFTVRKQKHRSAFLVLTQATQGACSGLADNKNSLLPTKKPRLRVVFQMARPEGLEPSTYRLTAGRSTIELRANKSF